MSLVGLALTTSWWGLLGLVFTGAALRAVRLVLAGTTGRGLVEVLQRTGAAELLYASGVFVGLVVATL